MSEQTEGNLRVATSRQERSYLTSPQKLLLLVVLITMVAALVICSDDREQTGPQVAQPAATSRPASEAITQFIELHQHFREASQQRNLSALSQLVTRDSPLIRIAEGDINQLISDGVLDRSTFHSERIAVASSSSSEVIITQVVVIRPRFIDEETGEELKTSKPIRQTVKWTLQREDGQWKVHDALVISSKEVTS